MVWRRFGRLATKRNDLASDPGSTPYTALRETLKELEKIQLAGEPIAREDWIDLLVKEVARRLAIRIKIVYVNPNETSALDARTLKRQGVSAHVFRGARTGDAEIVVLSIADEADRIDAILHELSHIIAGHPLPLVYLRDLPEVPADSNQPVDTGAGTIVGDWWIPKRSLARRQAPRDRAWIENDSNERVKNLVVAHTLGTDVYNREELFLEVD